MQFIFLNFHNTSKNATIYWTHRYYNGNSANCFTVYLMNLWGKFIFNNKSISIITMNPHPLSIKSLKIFFSMKTVDSATAIPLLSLTYFHSVMNKTGNVQQPSWNTGKVSVLYTCIRWDSYIKSSFNDFFYFNLSNISSILLQIFIYIKRLAYSNGVKLRDEKLCIYSWQFYFITYYLEKR
jgi:hypothetical protein